VQYLKLKIDREQLRAIAKITKVFGVRGEVKLYSYARTVEEFQSLQRVLCGVSEANTVFCEIENVRTRGDDIYVKFKNIDDRTASEKLVGKFLFVEELERKQLPKGSFFIDELVGCEVRNVNGKKLGVLKAIDEYPGQKIYVVTTPNGEVLMPGVKEIVHSVDIKGKIIIVTPPGGMFDGEAL
jgi:16S rRNA processing protein RimM